MNMTTNIFMNTITYINTMMFGACFCFVLLVDVAMVVTPVSCEARVRLA